MSNKSIINFEKNESPSEIATANGKFLLAIGKVILQILTIVNKKKQHKELKDVWYVPEISKNFFSMLAIHDRYAHGPSE